MQPRKLKPDLSRSAGYHPIPSQAQSMAGSLAPTERSWRFSWKEEILLSKSRHGLYFPAHLPPMMSVSLTLYPNHRAWVEFATVAEAAKAASWCDGKNFSSHHRRIQAKIAPTTELPSSESLKLSYKDFAWELLRREAKTSATVLITGLPKTKAEKNVRQMVEECGLDELDEGEDEQSHGIKRISTKPGGLEVEFECEEDAERFFENYDGVWWKNETLHVQYCCVESAISGGVGKGLFFAMQVTH